LFIEANAPRSEVRQHRSHQVPLTLETHKVVIRDQAPLRTKNLRLAHDFTFDELVELLYSHVFLWPSDDASYSEYGRRHYDRYCTEQPNRGPNRVRHAAEERLPPSPMPTSSRGR
jgi:hypothetical protein